MSDGHTERLETALAGRYKVEKKLGEGGMATAYLAEDIKHERKVALKILKPELAAVIGADRFLAEIKTTANLQHPHILPLFDSGESEGFLYYVMPFDVADALDYAHGSGARASEIAGCRRSYTSWADFGPPTTTFQLESKNQWTYR